MNNPKKLTQICILCGFCRGKPILFVKIIGVLEYWAQIFQQFWSQISNFSRKIIQITIFCIHSRKKFGQLYENLGLRIYKIFFISGWYFYFKNIQNVEWAQSNNNQIFYLLKESKVCLNGYFFLILIFRIFMFINSLIYL